MGSLFSAIATLLLCLNLAGSFVVLRHRDLSTSQRTIQLLVIWLVPIIGSIICIAFASSQSNGSDSGLDRKAFAENVGVEGTPSGVPGICSCNSEGGADGGVGD